MSSKEVKENFESIVEVAPERGEITVHNTKDSGEKERVFSFDLTFEPGCQQERIFKQAALPIIESVLEGYNGTIFAYGQTGTGKTHTMEGQRDSEAHKGIIPRTFEHIINAISGTVSLIQEHPEFSSWSKYPCLSSTTKKLSIFSHVKQDRSCNFTKTRIKEFTSRI
jgi:kinesin family protein 3/17